MKRALPALWICFIYVLVVVSEGKSSAPPWGTWERLFYEAYHTLIHAGVFAVQVWLTARAVGADTRAPSRDISILIGLGTLLGLGIEILQWNDRPDYVFVEGLWDMFSDFLGAVAGWLIYRRLTQLERKPVQT